VPPRPRRRRRRPAHHKAGRNVSAGEWHYMPFLLCLEIVIGMLAGRLV
jgi:hypothetical protein